MVKYAYKYCEFYKRKYSEYSFDPDSLKDLSDIKKVPVLTKEEIQTFKMQMVSSECDVNKLIPDMTGGSTGSPLHYYYDERMLGIRRAITIRHDRWSGWDIGKPVAYLWAAHRDTDIFKGIKIYLRNVLLERTYILNTSNIGKDDLREFTDLLKKKRIQYIIGYASSLYLYAKYIAGINDKEVRPKAIISTAEGLDDMQQVFIENTFKCKVFNRYGCRELNLIASECDKHEGLHINSECLFLEVNNVDADDQLGEIILSDLCNNAMPFIRYRIKDMGILYEKECSCGRGLPLIKSINGRATDFIITPRGKLVSGPSVTITVIAKTPGLIQGQIIQDKINHLIFRAVVDDSFEIEGKKFVRNKFIEYFGNDMIVDFDIVDKIDSESSGKYRFSISHVIDEELLNNYK